MRLFLLAVLICISISVSASPNFNPGDLSVTWEVIKNDAPKPGQSLNAITITNNGKSSLPASGWKLYFNSARMVAQATPTGNAKIDFINGDLFSLTPTESFGELKPGKSVRIEFVDDDVVVNTVDGPEGFYLVWDDQPEKGYNLGAFTVKPFSPVYAGLVTPEIIYNQNKNITDIPEEQLTKVFPTPVSYRETGGYFTLNKDIAFGHSGDGQFVELHKELKSFLEPILGPKLVKGHDLFFLPKTDYETSIEIVFEPGHNDEGYELNIASNGIKIKATNPIGAFYGIQSLKTLIPPSAYAHPQKSIQIPCVEIKDEPRFAYRAFMLDVGRNFHPKEEVLRILDVMALYKLNTFHFHLTEDEGWRLEIPALPELTSFGAKRSHSLDSKNSLPASHGSGGDESNIRGSGYYTKADYIEILKYAQARHITVLPEIETPGHARAAVKAMLARYNRLMAEGKKEEAGRYLLSDPDDKSVYSSAQAWNDNVINVALPSTYNFIEMVVDGIQAIYKEAGVPLTTIHFGGDEVPRGVWERSPAVDAFKAAHPEIQNTNDLWYYYYGRVNEILKSKGLKIAGWEEMPLRRTKLDGNPVYLPNPDFAYQHWQAEVWNNTLGDGSEDLAYKLANGGYKVVLSPVTNFYLDMAHYKSFDEPGYYWGAFSDIDKQFSFIPYDYFKNSKVDRNGLPIDRKIFVGKQRLTDYGKTNIIGLQSALWGETIKSNERLEYMLLPRLLAFAERAWASDPDWATEKNEAKSDSLYQIAWVKFLNVIGKREMPRLNYLDGGFNFRIPKPGVVLQDGKYFANVQFPGLTIRYTTNGKQPDAKSPIYKDAVTNGGQGVKFRAFDNKGRGSNVTETANQ
ncbi:family 20 glycosylhydrolase [Mucilaginibacter ginsenosidivorans]|uniref:beta-N-acetylhexosaminidase n=1 Tax=Mucilaginibacter ginsenosidivorans TaxID=398053 RepID=A0A5B8UVG0_9SPHI|nr:family 20 glycosylhydrolase [Mucilaginibacter ginsenosidivorans]QEC62912.1 family 20 glycosylhydrolase [Mucilaginibacter ginsenosidivorans]